MLWQLTEEAKVFLDKLEEALKLPTGNTACHKWLAESIAEFRNPESIIQDYYREIGRMLKCLARYADSETTDNKETAEKFYELCGELIFLYQNSMFIEMQGGNSKH
jgi:hypothetical protein